jgi:bacteriocin biosynthesis cyclodehydratase domain-containing protein
MYYLNPLHEEAHIVTHNLKPHFIALDPFGVEVLHHLRKLVPDRSEFMQLAISDRLPRNIEFNSDAIYVPISGSPIGALYVDLDERAYRDNLQFMPVMIDGSDLRVGPWVVPRQTPCWECWNERLNSQHYFAEERSFLIAEHCRQPGSYHLAFMPFTASLAAARIAITLDGSQSVRRGFGTVWTMNIFTRDASVIEYVGRHRCPKCSLPDVPHDRSIAALRQYSSETR